MTGALGIRMAALAMAYRAKVEPSIYTARLGQEVAAALDLSARAERELDSADPVRVAIEDLADLMQRHADRALRLDAADRLLHCIDAANAAAAARPWADRVDIHG
jgi:hypothetical protein